MAEGLRSKSVSAKDNTESSEDFATKFQHIQYQIQKLVIESRMPKPNIVEDKDFAVRLSSY